MAGGSLISAPAYVKFPHRPRRVTSILWTMCHPGSSSLVRLCCRISPNCETQGRALAQAISRWLPTAAARVRSQVRSCGICGGQSGTVAGFLQVLRFPLPILIPPTTP
jgi:hypothetical protein